MQRHPGQQQRRGVRVAQPVRRPALRQAGQPLAQPVRDPVDPLGPHRGQPRLAVEVDEAEPLVGDLEPGPPGPLSQVPQVVAVKALQLIRDVDAPAAPALDPGPVRMIPGDDLDERRASRARVPVGVGQAQHLAQAHARLRQSGKKQAVPQRSRPSAAGRIPRRARLQDRRDLRRGQQRADLPPPAAQRHRAAPARPGAPIQVSQERPVAAAPRRPGPRPGQRRGHPVRVMVVAVEADHRGQPRRQRRFRQPGRRGGRRIQQHHARRGPLPQPGDEPGQRGHVRPGPVPAVQLQVPPPQLQRLGIRADRVRRRAGDPVMLEELLHRPHLPVVGPQHGPGPVPVRQLDRLHADTHLPPMQTLFVMGR